MLPPGSLPYLDSSRGAPADGPVGAGHNVGVNSYVVSMTPEAVDGKAVRQKRNLRIGGSLLLAVGTGMLIFSATQLIAQISDAKAPFGWLVTVAFGAFTIWVGLGQFKAAKAIPTSADGVPEVFTLSRQGISMPVPGNREPVVERRWGSFTLRRGEAKGKPVLHFLADKTAPHGDFQLTQMSATAEEIDSAMRLLSGGKYGIDPD